jgi:hypothetical protein
MRGREEEVQSSKCNLHRFHGRADEKTATVPAGQAKQKKQKQKQKQNFVVVIEPGDSKRKAIGVQQLKSSCRWRDAAEYPPSGVWLWQRLKCHAACRAGP